MNRWKPKLLAPSAPDLPLSQRIGELLRQQRATWDLFRKGEEALGSITTKKFYFDNRHVIVQANPGRFISTSAKVDPQSIAKRPCFLCPESLPPAERGIASGDFVLLPNPYPILCSHLTIAFNRHEPQRIAGHIPEFIALVKELGPAMFLLYNGPRCGASAPDHMHFQACAGGGVPLFEQLPSTIINGGIEPLAIGGRNLLAGSFADAADAADFIGRSLAALQTITGEPEEPMLNIVARFSSGRYSIAFFPRAKHRSARYFAPPDRRLSISPAAMEMAGIVVVAEATHFDRVDAEAVRTIYREVTLGPDLFSRLAKAVA